jgi:hypothetical protein
MANILSITTNVAGQVGSILGGVVPRSVKIITTDSLSTVTTAGYLNPTSLQGYTIYNTDMIELWYGAVAGFQSIVSPGTFGIFTASISNGVITLVQWSNPGDVLLPVVSGDIAQFNGTTGQISDSGISAASLNGRVGQLGTLSSVSVTLNPTQMASAYAIPVQLIGGALASQMILILSAQVYTASTGNTPYATGTAPIIQYSSGNTNGQHGTGTIATAAGLVAGDITAATSQVRNLGQIASAALTGLSGLGIYFSNATAAYTGGTGTNITFTIQYVVLTATV